MLPLLATCDRWDIGGVSAAQHEDTGEPTIFVYDGAPGGAGFAERGAEDAAAWVRATADMIAECPRSEEHTSELQSRGHLVCRLLLEKKKYITFSITIITI